jgi:hypothetical protein
MDTCSNSQQVISPEQAAAKNLADTPSIMKQEQ